MSVIHIRVRRRLRAALVGIALGLGALPPASAQDGRSALTELMDTLSGLNTLAGRFEQQTLGDAGEPERSLEGEFRLQRPDRLYWYTEPPFEQAIYADGETL